MIDADKRKAVFRSVSDPDARAPDEPGVEMQHDTTVYQVALGGQRARLIARLLYLRYSKRCYLQLDIRRRLLHRFPYGLLYRVDPDKVVVLAVAHLHRHPAYWVGRT